MGNPQQVLNLIFHNTTQPMWVFRTSDWKIVDVNTAAIDVYGYTKTEFLNKTLKDLRPEKDRELFDRAINEVVRDTPSRLDVRHQDKKGRIFWVDVATYPAQSEDTDCRLAIINNIQETLDNKAAIARKATELQKVLDNSLDVICSFDVNGFFIQCSKAAAAIWGYEPAELVGRHYLSLVFEDDKSVTQAVHSEILSGKEVKNFQNRLVRSNGTVVYILWSARWDADEQAMFCIARDATEKVKADRENKEKSRRITNILESIKDGFFAVDKNWIVTYWNSEAERILQMPRYNILYENLWEVYKDAVHLDFYSQYHRAVNEQIPVHFEEYYPQLDMWIDVTAYPSSDGLSVYFKDVTERKKSEALIRESKERYDIIAKATNDIIWDWDLQNNRIIWSEALTLILGYENTERCQSGAWWVQNLHPEDLDRVKQGVYKVIDEGGSWSDEYRFRCADGSYKIFLDRGYLIHDGSGKAVRMIGSMQDISQLKQKENQLCERNKKILEIAHVNSHQVRKPLANILGLVDAVMVADDASIRELLLLIKESSLELDRCLRNIAEKTYSLED